PRTTLAGTERISLMHSARCCISLLCGPIILVSGLLSPGVRAADDVQTLRSRARESFAPLPPQMPGSETDTRPLVKLGKKIYLDPHVSANGTISCNTCHQLTAGGTYIHAPRGASGKRGDRNSPTVLNAGLQFA